ncbi:ABC transporter ATP-binding protein [Phreatobacter stygius]|uniref:ATP-binding cassette domain-containing protein n=1 Tax=Phreatobacter stygius TaxID=1940610 RepID=A0A4D7B057_9HYPH|nr:ATP-binding cassette domain-containing protein [Phreatobacter stygius]QCI63400.1 ATP-binding cassette domain-containing protein [Phreatobacter stygius]
MRHDPANPVAPAGAPLLAIGGIAHSFGGFSVLRDVSIGVGAGRIVGLLGPNGSGKTTLFNIISGFLTPGAGSLSFDGREITRLDVQARSRLGITRTFQTPKVFESLSTRDNVALGFYKQTGAGVVESLIGSARSRREMADIRERSSALMTRFNLAALADAPAALLTAGQRRNLEIARALAGAPKLLMLDEPSTGLTRDEADALGQALKSLGNDAVTVFVVSHDMEFMRIVDVAHVLYFGEIIASGDMRTVQADPKVRQIYLGT